MTTMADNADQLIDTQRAFDSVADDYDGPIGNNLLVQEIRKRTLAAVTSSIPRGASLLDLGCGTGLDAVELGRQGYRVTAVDWSPAMVRRAEARVRAAGLAGVVQVDHLGIHQLDRLPASAFDAAYSNLGVLNCVPDLEAAARLIRDRLRPAGSLIASVIGRVCPWELVLFGLKRQWSRAGLRWTKNSVPVSLNGQRVWTRYYTPNEFASAFAGAGFRLTSLRGLGLLTPPPCMIAFAQRHHRGVRRLQAIEDQVAGWPGLRHWGDHFLIVMRRVA